MKIGIVCNDTRGGVEPYVALALALRARGHDVRAVAPRGLADMFADRGFATVPLPGTDDAARFAASGIAEQGTLATMRLTRRELPRRLEVTARATIAACDGCDLMTGGIGGMVTGLAAATALGLPWLTTHLQPLGRVTGRYPGTLLPGMPRWLGAPGRWASHALGDLAAWLPFRPAMRQVRRAIGVPAGRDPAAGLPILYGFSGHIVPLPEDARHIVTGYWQLPTEETPPIADDLAGFLDRDGPVIGIGFGSMGSADPVALGALAVTAARRAGARVVLLGDGVRAAQAADVFIAREAPHARLFPRLDAIVHHGGAGTTGAAFAAGRPQIVVPFAVDQPFWGARVAALGCGPLPIPRRALTADGLGAAIGRALHVPGMARQAAAISDALAEEDGAAAAAAYFDDLQRA